MNDTDIAASIERIMAGVDYYLHCELDDDYDHDRPAIARRRLKAMLRVEMLRIGAVSLMSRMHRTSGDDGLSQENRRSTPSALFPAKMMQKGRWHLSN
jgi:hypothetical protein